MDTRALAHELRLRYQEEILRVMQDLVRIPSQNTPPVGEELACQEYIARYLGRLGLASDVYEPDQVPGLIDHPSYWPGRQYGGRPNVSARLAGLGGGHSLLLTGHADTVVLGESPWTKDPFGGEIADGKLYGLGSIDMKGPLGAVLVMVRALVEQQVPLRGDLAFESVVDEEEGGVNATIAGRLRHGPMDGAVIPECTDLKIYPAARGVLVTNFIFTSTAGTWLQVGTSDQKAADAVEQMGYFLTHLDELRATRRAVPVPPLYLSYPDPVPVQVTKIYAGGWGPRVPIVVPPEGRIELIVQTIPGEQRADVLGQQVEWLESVIARYPDVFITHPEMKFRLRWLPPTSMDPAHPLVQTCIHSVAEVMGREPDVLGAPYACDMFALQQDFRMPALLFGPAGANAHSADEYIDIENLFTWWESLLVFVLKWCETDG